MKRSLAPFVILIGIMMASSTAKAIMTVAYGITFPSLIVKIVYELFVEFQGAAVLYGVLLVMKSRSD